MIIRSSLRLATCAVAVVLLGVACGGGSNETTEAPTQDATPATVGVANETAPSDNPAAPEILQFSNALVGGGELDVSTLTDKPTAFWFWAPT
jgi:hypothetical protein